MMNQDNLHKNYIMDAIKLENSKSILELFDKNITSQRYEKISELYEKAANITKLHNQQLAIDYFIKASKYLEKSNLNDYKLKTYWDDIATLYLNIDYLKSIVYKNKVLNWYKIHGNIYGITKTYKDIGTIYKDNKYIKEAFEVYLEIIKIIELDNKYLDIKKHAVKQIGELYYMEDSIIDLLTLAKLYINLGYDYLKLSLGSLCAKDYVFNGLLMNIANDDIVETNIVLNKYLDSTHTFINSREHILIENIINAVEMNDHEKISFLASEYDKITPLDKIQIKLLLIIKENIKKNINHNDIDHFDENDLC